MKHTLALLFTTAFLSSASAETVKVGDTDVVFDTPSGFKPLTEEQIAAKFPGNRVPSFVVGNLTAMTTIAFDVKKEDLPQSQIPEAKEALSKAYGRVIPGVVWVKNEVIELAGQKWVYLEMTSSSPDVDIHNIVLFTGYKDRSMLFNFNSTGSDFARLEKEIRASVNSMKIPKELAPDAGFPKPK